MELLHSPWSIQLRIGNSNIGVGETLRAPKKVPRIRCKNVAGSQAISRHFFPQRNVHAQTRGRVPGTQQPECNTINHR